MPNLSPPYTPTNWYWIIADSTTQVYSSVAVAYVPTSDPTYLAWVASGHKASRLPAQQDLFDYLTTLGIAIPGGETTSDTLKDGMFSQIPRAVQVWAFAVDNRVRVLEGQAPRTANQFKNYVKGLL